MSDTHWQILTGDVRETLALIQPQSVQTCVTSPPYWGLRDYGHAWQIGLESTPEAYVAHLVDVFRLVRTALKDDGTLWLNLGDSYANTGGADRRMSLSSTIGRSKGKDRRLLPHAPSASFGLPTRMMPENLKPKDLVGIPWRVAFALQADGWYLRSDIIWSKPNPMPESVTDRPTKAHEYIFLLSKQASYYYDAAAILEPLAPTTLSSNGIDAASGKGYRSNITITPRDRNAGEGPGWGNQAPDAVRSMNPNGRNKRSVWHVATQPYAQAHFAVFPEALIEPCILAGTSEKGQCPACGKAWVRVVEREQGDTEAYKRPKRTAGMDSRTSTLSLSGNGSIEWAKRGGKTTTTGWESQCACNAGDHVPQLVLDPFAGSGTTGAVSIRHQRNFIGCELNPAYVELARTRIGAVSPLFAQDRTVAPAAASVVSPLLGLLDVV